MIAMGPTNLLVVSLLSALFWPLVSLDLNELPDIKSRLDADLTYRVMFQMQMKSLGFLATVEEWGNLKSGMFRLDLVVDRQRITYLFLGPSKNNDIFLYKPFVCQQLSFDSVELYLLKKLFEVTSRRDGIDTSSRVQAHGFGPLWMLAKENAATVSVNVSKSTNTTTDMDEQSVISYSVTDWQNKDTTTANYMYKLYFRQDREGFVDMIDWLNSKGGYLLGRAVQVKFSPLPFDQSVFELPVGFGCERSSEQPPEIPLWHELWPEGEPNQALFEVVTSRLLDDTLNKWESRRSKCHLTQATLHLHNRDHTYYVAQEEFRPDHEMERITHLRHVTSSTGGISQLLIYSIDDTTGSCETRRDDLANLVKFRFSEDSSPSPSTQSLDLDLVKYLVEDNKGYHLIQKLEEPLWDDEVRREAVYERRMAANQRELYNWDGPVSIVKRFKLDTSSDRSLETIQVFFYSADSQRLLRKASINVVDHGHLGLRSLHELTDISACFGLQQKESMLIKYPIASPEVATKLAKRLPTILQFLLLNILATTSLGLLQLSNLQTEVVGFFVEARLTVLELPLTLTFDRYERQTLVHSNDTSTILEKVALDEEACGASCARYNCYQFSYDWFRQRCLLELSDRLVEHTDSDNSNLYSFSHIQGELPRAWTQLCANPNLPESLHLSPRAVAACFKQLAKYQAADEKEQLPLSISVSLETKESPVLGEPVKLVPTEVLSESDPLDWPAELANLHEPFIQVDYVLLLEEAGFLEEPIKEHFVGISYEQCSEYCADADCRSFAYSDPQQTCDLTNLHRLERIAGASKKVPGSSIFVLDYLSKFEDLGWALRVESPAGQVNSSQEHDCAVACMEETSFSCQGFYQCPKSTCLLQNVHVREDKSLQDNLWIGASSSPDVTDSDRCRFFSRSYLSQFGKLYSTALRLDQALPVGPLEQAIVGAEGCAKWCTEKGCAAFDVCHQSSGSVCRLIYRAASSEMVEAKQGCNTFLLSDKSQFNHLHGVVAFDDSGATRPPDQAATVMNDGASPSGSLLLHLETEQDLLWAYLSANALTLDHSPRGASGGSVYMDLFALFMGLLMGASMGFAYLRRHTVITLIVRAIDG